MYKLLFPVLVVASATGFVPFAFAQDPRPANPTPKPIPQEGKRWLDGKEVPRDTAAESDAILAEWLFVDNAKELALAKIAQSKSDNGEVKAFAQRMIDEHTKFAADLRPFRHGGAMRGEGNDDGGARDVPQGRDDNDSPTRGGDDDEKGRNDGTKDGSKMVVKMGHDGMHRGDGEGIDHFALLHDLGKKCRESATTALNEKSGAAFDRCYIGMQIADHQGVLDKVDTFQKYASPKFAAVLADAHTTVGAHLEHAKDLMKTLEKDYATTARKAN